MHTGLATMLVLLAVAAGGAAALPDLEETFRGIADSYGGTWGFGVVEFPSGDAATYNADRAFEMEIPHLPLTAIAIELSNEDIIPLDELIARNEYFWERLHWAQQGGRGMCMAVIWSIGEGRIAEWLADRGYDGTEINGVIQDYPLCPAYDPNRITVRDAMAFLGTVYDNLDHESVRKIGDNPPFSEHVEETLGFQNKVYGWMDVSDGAKQLYVIVVRDGEPDLGIVVMAEGLEDRTDVDRAFRTLYRALVN